MIGHNTTRQLPSQLAGSPLGAFLESPVFSTALNRIMLQGFSALLGMLAVQLGARAMARLGRSQLALNFAQEFRMTKRSLVGAALALVLVFTISGYAQEPPAGQEQPPAGQAGRQGGRDDRNARHRDMSPDAQLDRLDKHLNLSDDQKAKIKPILEKESQQIQDLRQDKSTAPQDRRARFQQLRQDTMAQIRPILNGDQQKKLDKMQQNAEQRREHRRGRGRPEGAPPSAPDQQ